MKTETIEVIREEMINDFYLKPSTHINGHIQCVNEYINRIQSATRPQIEAEIMAKQHSNGLIAGIALSAAFLINGHGEDSIAEDLLRETGIRSLSELRGKKVDNYDLDILKKVLPEKAIAGGKEG